MLKHSNLFFGVWKISDASIGKLENKITFNIFPYSAPNPLLSVKIFMEGTS